MEIPLLVVTNNLSEDISESPVRDLGLTINLWMVRQGEAELSAIYSWSRCQNRLVKRGSRSDMILRVVPEGVDQDGLATPKGRVDVAIVGEVAVLSVKLVDHRVVDGGDRDGRELDLLLVVAGRRDKASATRLVSPFLCLVVKLNSDRDEEFHPLCEQRGRVHPTRRFNETQSQELLKLTLEFGGLGDRESVGCLVVNTVVRHKLNGVLDVTHRWDAGTRERRWENVVVLSDEVINCGLKVSHISCEFLSVSVSARQRSGLDGRRRDGSRNESHGDRRIWLQRDELGVGTGWIIVFSAEKEECIRAFEDESAAEKGRGWMHQEGSSVMTYTHRDWTVVQFMLLIGKRSVRVGTEEYTLIFKRWKAKEEEEYVRDLENSGRMWVMAIRVPIPAASSVKSRLECAVGGEILRTYPPEKNRDQRGRLINLRFDVPISSRDRIPNRLEIEFEQTDAAGERFFEVPVISQFTEWCYACRDYGHSSQSDQCPINSLHRSINGNNKNNNDDADKNKNKNKNSKSDTDDGDVNKNNNDNDTDDGDTNSTNTSNTNNNDNDNAEGEDINRRVRIPIGVEIHPDTHREQKIQKKDSNRSGHTVGVEIHPDTDRKQKGPDRDREQKGCEGEDGNAVTSGGVPRGQSHCQSGTSNPDWTKSGSPNSPGSAGGEGDEVQRFERAVLVDDVKAVAGGGGKDARNAAVDKPDNPLLPSHQGSIISLSGVSGDRIQFGPVEEEDVGQQDSAPTTTTPEVTAEDDHGTHREPQTRDDEACSSRQPGGRWESSGSGTMGPPPTPTPNLIDEVRLGLGLVRQMLTQTKLETPTDFGLVGYLDDVSLLRR
ncbi:hypothetical protein CBR_g49478 [Chara braunii]|uniref:Uncharacterized protein n=1 Tax=Chara braunii TaxID=69332 RepID=A0A388K4Z8_CHABU|nr:hypothetical protein CBR_g49478 [Chara braunii]|eukprot:GBG65115.1 hypothetical protein CBR_g49478 [Chara braunii]